PANFARRGLRPSAPVPVERREGRPAGVPPRPALAGPKGCAGTPLSGRSSPRHRSSPGGADSMARPADRLSMAQEPADDGEVTIGVASSSSGTRRLVGPVAWVALEEL